MVFILLTHSRATSSYQNVLFVYLGLFLREKEIFICTLILWAGQRQQLESKDSVQEFQINNNFNISKLLT